MKHVLNYVDSPIDSTHMVSLHVTFELANGIPLAIFETSAYQKFIDVSNPNPLQPVLHRISMEIAPFGESIDACRFHKQVINDAKTGEPLLQLDVLSAFADKNRINGYVSKSSLPVPPTPAVAPPRQQTTDTTVAETKHTDTKKDTGQSESTKIKQSSTKLSTIRKTKYGTHIEQFRLF